jgi:hypothetical protein
MKRLILNALLSFVIISGIFLLDGCYPNDSVGVDESDVIITRKNDSVNFQTLKTYFMPDEVVPIRDDTSDHSPIDQQDLILNTIASNLQNYGWTRVAEDDENADPDVVISNYALLVTNTSVGWWYPYYPGWGYPGWGWGYGWGWYYPPYYPPVPVVSSWSSGTVLTVMVDPNNKTVVEGDTVAPVYWEAALHGILDGGGTTGRITKGIDQEFTQSEYLDLN